LRNRASAYQALGQIIDATADCSLAIALDPTNMKVFNLKQQIVSMLVQLNGLIKSLFY
jgi:DnaJ homolog subfamily C member 7